MKSYILALLGIWGTTFFYSGLVIAQETGRGAAVTLKTTAKVATKTGSQARGNEGGAALKKAAKKTTSATTVISKKTGERLTAQQVVSTKTEAGTGLVNGYSTTAGYYYAPGTTATHSPASEITQVSYSSNSSSGFNPNILLGGMTLISSAGLLQPLATLGSERKAGSTYCAECAKFGTSGAARQDPAVEALKGIENTDKPELQKQVENGGCKHLNNLFLSPAWVHKRPFELKPGESDWASFSTVCQAWQMQEFEGLQNLAESEITSQYCPQFKNLNDQEKKGVMTLLLSALMRGKDNFNVKRKISSPLSGPNAGPGKTQDVHGLCNLSLERVNLLMEKYKHLNITVNNEQDLYQPGVSGGLCVMDLSFDAIFKANDAGQKPVQVFANKAKQMGLDPSILKNELADLGPCRNQNLAVENLGAK